MNRATARQKAAELVSKMTVEEAASQLRYDAPAIDRLGVPAYNWWTEALHGVARAGTATSFPQAIALAASFDPELTKELAAATAKEASAAGLHVTFSPMCDLSRDARWGRCMEGTGEDPWLNARFAEATVLGSQGDGIEKQGNIAACVKHFAAYGAATAGKD